MTDLMRQQPWNEKNEPMPSGPWAQESLFWNQQSGFLGGAGHDASSHQHPPDGGSYPKPADNRRQSTPLPIAPGRHVPGEGQPRSYSLHVFPSSGPDHSLSVHIDSSQATWHQPGSSTSTRGKASSFDFDPNGAQKKFSPAVSPTRDSHHKQSGHEGRASSFQLPDICRAATTLPDLLRAADSYIIQAEQKARPELHRAVDTYVQEAIAPVAPLQEASSQPIPSPMGLGSFHGAPDLSYPDPQTARPSLGTMSSDTQATFPSESGRNSLRSDTKIYPDKRSPNSINRRGVNSDALMGEKLHQRSMPSLDNTDKSPLHAHRMGGDMGQISPANQVSRSVSSGTEKANRSPRGRSLEPMSRTTPTNSMRPLSGITSPPTPNTGKRVGARNFTGELAPAAAPSPFIPTRGLGGNMEAHRNTLGVLAKPEPSYQPTSPVINYGRRLETYEAVTPGKNYDIKGYPEPLQKDQTAQEPITLSKALNFHKHQFQLSVIPASKLKAKERQCLIDEKCALCLKHEWEDSELMVVFVCSILLCPHVVHAKCFTDTHSYNSISKPTSPKYTINPFSSPMDQSRFVRGPRNGLVLSLGLFHILSEVQFGHFKMDNLMTSYDDAAGQDYLNISALVQANGTRPVFSVRRGRLVLECSSPSTSEKWNCQANYDVTTVQAGADLVYICSDSKISVILSIVMNHDTSWAIERLSIALPPPKPGDQKPLSMSPQPRPRAQAQPFDPKGPQQARTPKGPNRTPPKQYSQLFPQQSQSVGNSPIMQSGHLAQFEGKGKWDFPADFAAYDLPSLATTQCGSRFLQHKVEEGNPEFLAMLFEQLLDHLPELIVDLFGNYLCQAMVVHATEEQRHRLLVKIKPHLVHVACARQGTRMVQKLVQLTTSPRDRRLLLEALAGNWPEGTLGPWPLEAHQATPLLPIATEEKADVPTVVMVLPPSPTGASASNESTFEDASKPLSASSPVFSPTGTSRSTTAKQQKTPKSSVSTSPTSTNSNVLNVTTSATNKTSEAQNTINNVPEIASPQVSSTSNTYIQTTTTTSSSNKTVNAEVVVSTTTTLVSSTSVSVSPASVTTTVTELSATTTTVTTSPQPEEDLSNWPVTNKASLLTLMKGPSGAHVIHAILDHWPVSLCRPIIIFAFESSAELGVHQHGLCVLKKCLTICSPPDLRLFSNLIQPHILSFINDQYGNYLIQHLMERCNAQGLPPEVQVICSQINWDLHRTLQTHYPWLSRQKFSSNVVEKCLRTPDMQLRSAIIEELTRENTISTLLQCSFGNYVMQHVLDVANHAQATQVIARIQPDLRLLKKNIRKKWERLLAKYDASQIRSPSVTVFPASVAPPAEPQRSPSPSPQAAQTSTATNASSTPQSSSFSGPANPIHGSLDAEFRSWQANYEGDKRSEYNEHKNGWKSKARKPVPNFRAAPFPSTPTQPQSPQHPTEFQFAEITAAAEHAARVVRLPFMGSEAPFDTYGYYQPTPQASYMPYSYPPSPPPATSTTPRPQFQQLTPTPRSQQLRPGSSFRPQ